MRSDLGGVGKRQKRPRITFCCERSGERQNEYCGYCDGGEFAIGYVGRHFVKVNLISRSVPIPPVTTLWHRYQVNNGQLYRIYEQRIDQFKKLRDMEGVAIRDTFTEFVQLDIDLY